MSGEGIVHIINEAVKRSQQSSAQAGIVLGEVVETSPLKIRVEDRFEISEKFLILTHNVKEHYIDVEIDMKTEDDDHMSGDHTHVLIPKLVAPTGPVTGDITCDTGNLNTKHFHNIKGKKKILIKRGLLKNEKVLLLRVDRGQLYVVLDRVDDHTTDGEWE